MNCNLMMCKDFKLTMYDEWVYIKENVIKNIFIFLYYLQTLKIIHYAYYFLVRVSLGQYIIIEPNVYKGYGSYLCHILIYHVSWTITFAFLQKPNHTLCLSTFPLLISLNTTHAQQREAAHSFFSEIFHRSKFCKLYMRNVVLQLMFSFWHERAIISGF